jgi:hypothetical protein
MHRLSLLLALLLSAALGAGESLPLVFTEDFEKDASRWQPTDAKGWKLDSKDGNHFFAQIQKQSAYKPPYRSPLNFALVKDLSVTDFVLEAKVQSTIKDYDHRDACLFFGYQGPSKFYYVHFGKKADDHANQIFIVNDAARVKISTKSTKGTPWTDAWHHVKVVRKIADGIIEVYFDDMKVPAMTAQDRTFEWGQVGVGTFDDTTNWDDVKVHGRRK